MKIELGAKTFYCEQVSVMYNFTEKGYTKTMTVNLSEPFENDMDYYEALNIASNVRITYPPSPKTYEYLCDGSRRHEAYINHVLLPAGEQMTMYIPVL